jgi:2-iminoacetate synthase ThiH
MPYQERATTLEKIISESNARRIGQIPEVMRTLVPSLPPEQQAAWLDQNWSLLTQRQAPNLDAGAGGSGRTVTLTDEQRQTAKRAGMTEEQFIAALKKAGRQP